jgi:kumamolisin
MTASAKLHPYFKKARTIQAHASGAGPWAIRDLCAAYGWPTGLAGGGVIAIVELGGGWTQADMNAFAKANNLPMPTIVDVSVDGTQNTPGGDADGEVALDLQIAWGGYVVATGHAPSMRVYWANNIAPAVRAAIKDGCDVCSISWGADEANWGSAAAQDMEQAAIEAAAAGMVILAASGDNDSSDGGASPANVDLPAGCPHIVGCGGTNKTRSTETVWNESPGIPSGEGTGGGYSTLFPMPAWQLSGGAPKGPGRMVPDVAAAADPNTGYEIYYGGSPQVVGGTSAVAPLYAGLLAAAGKKLGFITDKLWQNHGVFVDVTQGDNGMYHAQVGPDPCTGLGVPAGKQLDALLSAGTSPAPTPTPTPTPIPTPTPTPTPVPVPVPVPVPPPPAPGPTPPPPGTTVRLSDAIIWSESLLPPHGPLSRHAIERLVESGLRSHWPKGSTAVRLADAITWAEAELPNATLTRHAANYFIGRGLMKHWPKGLP